MEKTFEIGDSVRTPHGDEGTVVELREGIVVTEHEHPEGRTTRGEFEPGRLTKTEDRTDSIPPGQRKKRLKNLPTPIPAPHPPADLSKYNEP